MTYIDNCRKIKAFRDQNFTYKNYRIFDMAAWKVKDYVVHQPTGNIETGETIEPTPSAKVWLITWNKNNWNWQNFEEICEGTKAGQTFVESWACANSNPKIGDEVFLIKLGDQPRCLIGHGTVKQAQYEKERAPGNISGDGFIWPCSANIITSLAGTRTHPVTGQERYHSGVDIGCPAGDPVWAAASGTVSSAGWNGNYGNCVMISHDNGYTTVYGHLDSIAVSSGQSVSAGTTVGYCGSTGLATGPHLHFEIRSGGDFLDPLDFFSGGSFVYMLDA